MAKEAIKEFSGKILGYLEDQGDRIVATDFYGRKLGYYDKRRNVTCDFYGRIVCQGNGASGLVLSAKS